MSSVSFLTTGLANSPVPDRFWFRHRRGLGIVAAGAALFFLPVGAAAATPAGMPRVVVAVMDRLVLQDLLEAPAPWPQLLERGAVALMNTNTGGSRTPANALATLSAGVPAVAGGNPGLALGAGETYREEPAARVFYRRTGRPASASNVVHLDWPQIRARDPRVGYVGTAVHRAGGSTAVLGNADLPGEYRRQAALLAMDARGAVDYGRTDSSLLRQQPERLLPVTTDYTRLLGAYQELPPDVQLVVLDLGDMSRLDEVDHLALPERVAREKFLILQESGEFIRRLLAEQESHTLVMVVVPTPSSAALGQKNLVTPLLVFYPAPTSDLLPPTSISGQAGWLASPSTRRAGLVTNLDVTATILDWLGLAAGPELAGRPVFVARTGAADELLKINRRMVFTYQLRPPVVKGYIAGQMVAICGVVLSLFLSRPTLHYWRLPLLGLTAVPLSLLLVGGLPHYRSATFYLTIFLIFVVAITWFAGRGGRGLKPFILLAGATVAALALDTLTGDRLIRQSILGYDPLAGARYYGIGNEFMGVLIGAGILTAANAEISPPWARTLVVGLMFGTIAFLLASPAYGANAGGTITALLALVFTFLRLRGWRVGWRQVAALGVSAVALVLLLGVLDARQAVEARSHLGQAASLVTSGGTGEAVDIITRKLATNIRLMRYSVWSRVLLLALAAVILLCYRPVNLLHRVWQRHPRFYFGFTGTLVGAITALIFNDSGIVAAATMMIFAMAPLLYLLLKEREAENFIDKP